MDQESLLQENQILKKKLAIAQSWMAREVKNQINSIAVEKITQMTSDTKQKFFHENVEEIFTQKISDFFGEILLMNIPSGVVENIISAEVAYYNMRENPSADGLAVVSSYHKSLDILIESYITKWFRKFARKQNQTILRVNDPLEKSLNSVVNQGYILSVGRLFHLLKLIKQKEKLNDYGRCFQGYLEKYLYLQNVLLDDDFYEMFEVLMDSEILWKKRHVGKISLAETCQARNILLWDLHDKNSLIYKLIHTQSLDY